MSPTKKELSTLKKKMRMRMARSSEYRFILLLFFNVIKTVRHGTARQDKAQAPSPLPLPPRAFFIALEEYATSRPTTDEWDGFLLLLTNSRPTL